MLPSGDDMNPATSSRRYPHSPICLNMYHTETLMNSWFPPNRPVASTVSVTIATRPAGMEIRMLTSRALSLSFPEWIWESVSTNRQSGISSDS